MHSQCSSIDSNQFRAGYCSDLRFGKQEVPLVLPVPANLRAADWPQWHGPNRDGKSADMGLRKEWPKEGPPLAWKITGLGGGYSAPSIAAHRIFGMSHRGDDEVVWALS